MHILSVFFSLAKSFLFIARFSLCYSSPSSSCLSNSLYAISERRVFPRPLPRQILVPRSIRLVNVRVFRQLRIVRVLIAHQGTNSQQNLRNRQRRRPLLFQNVQTNAPVRVHVRMVHFCLEIHLRRFERVIRREVDRDKEETALVRTIRWANDGGVPVENIVLGPWTGRARGWRIFL